MSRIIINCDIEGDSLTIEKDYEVIFKLVARVMEYGNVSGSQSGERYAKSSGFTASGTVVYYTPLEDGHSFRIMKGYKQELNEHHGV